MLTAEGYLNYKQEPRVQIRDRDCLTHYTLAEARAFAAELQAAIESAEQQLDQLTNEHESRKVG